MTLYPEYPAALGQGEFARVRFTLELLGSCRLAPGTLLGLRRPLQRAARQVLGPAGDVLFDVPVSSDPLAVRRHQKPAPGFVVQADAGGAEELLEGDHLELEILLLGTAMQAFGDFRAIVRQLGGDGLAHGEGRFEIAAISCCSADGSWRRLPAGVPLGGTPPLELIRFDHWLDARWPEQLPVALEFITPLRLLAGGRVLRRPSFAQLFPFLLRRVTSLLYTHCDLETGADPAPLLQAAQTCRAAWRELQWCDWRETGGSEPVGGLLGRLELAGPELNRLLWVLLLATLLGSGKGAAYGAGRCRLVSAG